MRVSTFSSRGMLSIVSECYEFLRRHVLLQQIAHYNVKHTAERALDVLCNGQGVAWTHWMILRLCFGISRCLSLRRASGCDFIALADDAIGMMRRTFSAILNDCCRHRADSLVLVYRNLCHGPLMRTGMRSIGW